MPGKPVFLFWVPYIGTDLTYDWYNYGTLIKGPDGLPSCLFDVPQDSQGSYVSIGGIVSFNGAVVAIFSKNVDIYNTSNLYC